MPTYEYQCKVCSHTFEEFQSMSEPPLTRCPSCKEESLARLIGSGAGVIFKGSGFYTTDYKRNSKGNGEEKGKKPKEKKSETKTSDTCTSNPDTCPRCGPDE